MFAVLIIDNQPHVFHDGEVAGSNVPTHRVPDSISRGLLRVLQYYTSTPLPAETLDMILDFIEQPTFDKVIRLSSYMEMYRCGQSEARPTMGGKPIGVDSPDLLFKP